MWVTVLNLVKLEEFFERLKKNNVSAFIQRSLDQPNCSRENRRKNLSVFLIGKKTLIDREKQELIRNELNLTVNVKYCSIKADLVALNYR